MVIEPLEIFLNLPAGRLNWSSLVSSVEISWYSKTESSCPFGLNCASCSAVSRVRRATCTIGRGCDLGRLFRRGFFLTWVLMAQGFPSAGVVGSAVGTGIVAVGGPNVGMIGVQPIGKPDWSPSPPRLHGKAAGEQQD